MNEHIKFLIIFLLSVSQVLLLIAVINWWVDPYGIFHPDEYNPQKSIWMSKQLRLAKAYKLKQLKPLIIHLECLNKEDKEKERKVIKECGLLQEIFLILKQYSL